MYRFSVLSILLFTSACSSIRPTASQSTSQIHQITEQPIAVDIDSQSIMDSVSIPDFDLTWNEVPEQEYAPVSFSPDVDVEQEIKQTPDYSIDDTERRETFELQGSSAEVIRSVVVDFAGLGLVYDSALSGSLTFSGGPFTVDEALDALLLTTRGQNFSFDRVGNVVVVSGTGSETSTNPLPSTGIYALKHSSPWSVSQVLTTVYPGLSVSFLGHSVVLSGPGPFVSEALAMVAQLDSQSNGDLLPWRAVVVSSDLSENIADLDAVFSSGDDPLSLSFTPVGERGLVLLTGHNSKALDEAVLMLQRMDEGLSARFSRVLSLSEPEPLLKAVEAAFEAEIEAKTLSASLVGSQLLLTGQPAFVSAASSFVGQFSPEPAFIEVRGVVAETRRGSAVDRSFTLGYTPGQLGGLGAVSMSQNASSVSAGGFAAALTYLDQDTQTRLLATPRLSVAAGSSAELVVGSQVPVLLTQNSQDEGGTTQTVAYRDAGVKLSVSPVMLADGRVRLDVSQELSDATQNSLSGLDSPSFSTRSMKTQVVVAPGETVAVAGLDYDSSSLSLSGSTVGSSEARKLVILLSATPSDSSARRASVVNAMARLNTVIPSGAK